MEKIDLSTLSPELVQVIKFEELQDPIINLAAAIHEESKEAIQLVWEGLPNSACNVLDNFEQFHALVTISQAESSLDYLGEFEENVKSSDLSEEEVNERRTQLLDEVWNACVKDMVKQLKKARRDPVLKREFLGFFVK